MFKNAVCILESSSEDEESLERDVIQETPKCLLKGSVINLTNDAESDKAAVNVLKAKTSTPFPIDQDKNFSSKLSIKPSFSGSNSFSRSPTCNSNSPSHSTGFASINQDCTVHLDNVQSGGKRTAHKSTEIIELGSSSDELDGNNTYSPKRIMKRIVQKGTERKATEQIDDCSQLEDETTLSSFVNQASLEELTFVFEPFELDSQCLVQNRPFSSWNNIKSWLKKQHKFSSSQLQRLAEAIRSSLSLEKLLEKMDRIRISCENSFQLLTQSKILSKSSNEQFHLKQYQLYGISWMNNLCHNGFGGILADEMGLGKTVQVISLISYLVNQGINYGPFLVITPSSTMDNWYCEFQKWTPHLKIAKYYGTIDERFDLRDSISSNISVIITTFSMATSGKEDKKYLRRIQPSILFVDEGHFLKNCNSQKYLSIFSIPAEHRFLLTGTPLQNDLLELFSLFQFMIAGNLDIDFEELKEFFSLNTCRKELLGRTEMCITKIKKLIEPFVLRRKKNDVLSDLPGKEEEIVECEMTMNQILLYKEFEENLLKYNNNVLIHLRKAANHALLFRQRYTEDVLKLISRQLFCELDFCNYSSVDDVEQELLSLNDYQIHTTCTQYLKRLAKYCLPYEAFLDSGKTTKTLEIVQRIIRDYPDEKILLFSQFICILDILGDIFDHHSIPYHRLDGSMAVSERHALMNSFNTNENIKVFLLSSKAAGFGINLVSANHVIIHDIDYNPHNDKQAEDRCHRIGQLKPVKIYKLISKDSVDEKTLDIASYKINLDAQFQ